MTELLSSFQLPPGTDKKGRQYDRHIGYEPGMKQLVEIVAGFQKDVKRINKCLTLKGAQNYIEGKKNWGAYEADITGPNGKPDGIKEVFVTDSKGNVRVINGYELGKTTYPIRKAYYTTFPTKATRKGHSMSEFKARINAIGPGLTPNGEPVYDMEPSQFGGEEFTYLRKPITPKALFKQYIFKPLYDVKKETYKQENVPPMEQAQIFIKGLSECFNKLIRDRVFERFGVNTAVMKQTEINKVNKSTEFKMAAFNLLNHILSNGAETSKIQADMDLILGNIENDVIGSTANRVKNNIETIEVPPEENIDYNEFL